MSDDLVVVGSSILLTLNHDYSSFTHYFDLLASDLLYMLYLLCSQSAWLWTFSL